MDYKELIRRLDDCGEFDGGLLDDAAEAMETLLAERDALINRGCMTCKNKGDRCICRSCFRSSGTEDCWEWRGPQKGK